MYVGDDFQRHFFGRLPVTRVLGVLHDRRLAMLGASSGSWSVYNRWSIFSLNLIGGPEMRVWTQVPWRLCLEVPAEIRLDRLLHVQVLLDDVPVPGAMLTIEQPGFSRQQRTDRNGTATFSLKGGVVGNLRIVATHPNAAMMRTTIQVRGPYWVDAEVSVVRAAADAATVVLRTAAGERTAIVPASRSDLLVLLGQAAGSGATVSVLIGDNKTVEAAEVGVPGARLNSHTKHSPQQDAPHTYRVDCEAYSRWQGVG